MEINKEIPTLEQKQTFWAEQLPNFEAKYWLPSHFEFLTFDIDQGNYVIKEDLDPSFEDDATEIWHRVNTGWGMWKKAIKFTEQKAPPEGFVLVPYDVADRCMSHISIAMCHPSNSNSENDVMQMDLDILESAIEAQEQSHELD